MSFTVNKRILSDGNAVIVDTGAKVIKAVLDINVATGQTPSSIIYDRQHEQEDVMYGIVVASNGDRTVATTAATGISAYEDELHGVLIPNPAGAEDQFRVPTVWAIATDYSGATFNARTAAVAGSVVWPPSGSRNGFVYELATKTAAGTSAPASWPTTPGETATDGGANVWTCREQNTFVKGCQGITIGATTQTDGYVCLLTCTCQDREDIDINVGDVGDLGTTDYA